MLVSKLFTSDNTCWMASLTLVTQNLVLKCVSAVVWVRGMSRISLCGALLKCCLRFGLKQLSQLIAFHVQQALALNQQAKSGIVCFLVLLNSAAADFHCCKHLGNKADVQSIQLIPSCQNIPGSVARKHQEALKKPTLITVLAHFHTVCLLQTRALVFFLLHAK